MLTSNWLRGAVMAVVAAVLFAVAPPGSAQSVAMVTDLSGRVTGTIPVAITAELPVDARVEVAAGGRLVAVYFTSGEEYSFTGPARIEFRAQRPALLSGAQPARRASPLASGAGVRIRPMEVSQGSFVMRNVPRAARVRLLALSGTKTLETEPEFRWTGGDSNQTWRFELSDETGRLLHEADATGGSFRLPEAVQLREGAGYTWRVSGRLPGSGRHTAAGDFTVADAALRARAQSLRPADGAPVSERVAYAAWLDQMELRDEARRYWRELAAERPEDARLKVLASQ